MTLWDEAGWMKRVQEGANAFMGWACPACWHVPGRCQCECPEHEGMSLGDDMWLLAEVHGVRGVLTKSGKTLRVEPDTAVG